MNLKEILSSIGLGEKKADVYLALMELGTASVLEISKKAGIKRPTVYDILEDLCHKNLVTQTFSGKKRKFTAENPSRLKQIPRQQEEQIEQMLPQLDALFNLSPQKPKLKYYQGVEGVRYVNDDVLTVRNKEYFYFGSSQNMLQILGEEYLENYVKKRIEKGIWSYAIRIKNDESNFAYLGAGDHMLRKVRFLPDPVVENIVALYIYDNKIAIISSQKECYGLIIESQELATLLKAMWKTIWSVSQN
ncbi:MAG: hypothetical protein GY786_16000 [Proteobacteria bacterium]|nr:hypothetical protein [Pseudomonadota bacterium]